MRKAFFGKQRTPGLSALHKSVRSEECFDAFENTKTATQVVRRCLADWSNFFKNLLLYKKNPRKWIKCPGPPHYKEKLAQIIFFNETIRRGPRIEKGYIIPTNNIFKIKSDRKFKRVIITPKAFGFVVGVCYEEEKQKTKTPGKGICCVDVGVNNLLAITSDKHNPILVNGRIVKSINQHYNKHQCKTSLRKRYWRLENYFHHVSKMLIENCKKHKIGTIIIGRNMGWKNRCKFGKVCSQNFQSIPFYLLLEKVKYKAEKESIEVVFTEEAYTSQASFLDRDPLPSHEKGVASPQFSGKRIKRGLYKSGNGTMLNADVNGSANIGRKVIQDSKFLAQLDKSLAARPVRINPLKSFFQSQQLEAVNSSNSVAVRERSTGIACFSHGGPKSRVFKDGDNFCAVMPDFVDLQVSPAGFGKTPEEARAKLEEEIKDIKSKEIS
jgi:putative transposase